MPSTLFGRMAGPPPVRLSFKERVDGRGIIVWSIVFAVVVLIIILATFLTLRTVICGAIAIVALLYLGCWVVCLVWRVIDLFSSIDHH